MENWSVAETIAQVTYGKSANPEAEENQTVEFQTGYNFGLTADTNKDNITEEWNSRGRPQVGTSERLDYNEWKRGYWAGAFQQLGMQHKETKQD